MYVLFNGVSLISAFLYSNRLFHMSAMFIHGFHALFIECYFGVIVEKKGKGKSLSYQVIPCIHMNIYIYKM